MPRVFTQPIPGAPPFRCELEIARCQAVTAGTGRVCQRRTFRIPFCLQHARSLLGLDVRRSRIPNAGCGLFTTRGLQPGDVIVPMLGRRHASLAALSSRRPMIAHGR